MIVDLLVAIVWLVTSLGVWGLGRGFMAFTGTKAQSEKSRLMAALWSFGIAVGGPIVPLIGWGMARKLNPPCGFCTDHAKLSLLVQLQIFAGYLIVVGNTVFGRVNALWMPAYLAAGFLVQVIVCLPALAGRPVPRLLVGT